MSADECITGPAKGPHRFLPLIAKIFLALLFMSAESFCAQELTTSNPNKLKAAFLSKFAQYVTWPKESHPPDGQAWKIGILGEDPFGELLDRTLKGRTELQHPFEIHRASKLEDLPACHIVFVGIKDSDTRKRVLEALKDKPVLTVGDDKAFLSEGGIIRFRLQDTLLLDINLDIAQAANLSIQTKMLEIAGAVVEKGKLRQFR